MGASMRLSDESRLFSPSLAGFGRLPVRLTLGGCVHAR